MSSQKPTIHEGVALLECDSQATLEETLRHLQGLTIHARRIGPRALVFPSGELSAVSRALHGQQCFPRIVGHAAEEMGEDAE
jgi:hypothetical protein